MKFFTYHYIHINFEEIYQDFQIILVSFMYVLSLRMVAIYVQHLNQFTFQ